MSGRLSRLSGVVAVVDTAGEGGFWGVSVHTPQKTSLSSQISTAVDQVRTMQFVLPFRVVVRNVTFELLTLEVGKLASAGLYDAGKNLVVDSGTISTTLAGVKTASITAVTLEPGVYWVAWACDGTVAQARFATGPGDYSNIPNEKVVTTGRSLNAASSGVLPATLGTIIEVPLNPLAIFFEP